MTISSVVRLLACLALCFAVATAGAVITRPEIPTWYATLAKPTWNPPNWAFPVAWNILYALMAVSLWLLWERAREGVPQANRAIGLFMLQLGLNAAWSPVFFALHAISAAFAILVALIVVLAATIWTSARVDRFAAWLLAPYLAWIVYAASLNGAIVVLN
jgi:tryptophan-rich sensory protein